MSAILRSIIYLCCPDDLLFKAVEIMRE